MKSLKKTCDRNVSTLRDGCARAYETLKSPLQAAASRGKKVVMHARDLQRGWAQQEFSLHARRTNSWTDLATSCIVLHPASMDQRLTTVNVSIGGPGATGDST